MYDMWFCNGEQQKKYMFIYDLGSGLSKTIVIYVFVGVPTSKQQENHTMNM